MFKRLFPPESSRYQHIQNAFKKMDVDIVNRLEILFPMWIMFAFQHYLIKSYDIAVYRFMEIDLNRDYLFSLIREDWIGVSNILFHSLLFLWLMKKFESFGLFRIVKMDSQTNFLLFLSIYSLIDVMIFGRMMFPLALLILVLYLLYRSDSTQIKIISILLTVVALILSLYQDEPIVSTATMVYLPFLVVALIRRSKQYLHYSQKYLLLILFIFLFTKELWFGLIGLGYFLFFYFYHYFSSNERHNWLKFDSNY
ncbi:MAG: hypothetical protein VX176_00425 [Candidatus Neomarinimicrobiota bacterium]|nr:hypothetical protein [Candidatus Neomarinimicrobiota bacterium]